MASCVADQHVGPLPAEHLHSGEHDRVIEQCTAALSRLPADKRWATGHLRGLQSTAYLLRGELGPSGDAARLELTVEN